VKHTKEKVHMDNPVTPVGPVAPVNPVTPVGPVAPVNPVTPVGPVAPVKQIEEVIKWERPDGSFLEIKKGDLHEKLVALKCTELRAIAKALKIGIKYWKLSKATLATQVIQGIKSEPIGVHLSNQSAINEMCDKLGVVNKLRLFDVKPVDGVVCKAVDLARNAEAAATERYAKLECKAPNETRPVWSVAREFDCPEGSVQLDDGCCVRIQDYTTVWDPNKLNAQCDGCQNMTPETRQMIQSQIDSSQDASKSLDEDFQKVLLDSKDAKLIMQTFQHFQKTMIFKLGGMFDSTFEAEGVGEEVPCKDESALARFASSTWGMLRNTFSSLFKAIGFVAGSIKWALGKIVMTLTTWGQKLAVFILTNPQVAKVMLATVKSAKREITMMVAEWFDANGFLVRLDDYLREKQIPSEGALAEEIKDFQSTEADWKKSRDLMRQMEEEKNETGMWAATKRAANSVSGTVSGMAAFVSDAHSVKSMVFGVIANLDATSIIDGASTAIGLASTIYLGAAGPMVLTPFLKGIGRVGAGVIKEAAAVSLYQSNVLESFQLVWDILNPMSVINDMWSIVLKYPFLIRYVRSMRDAAIAWTVKLAGGGVAEITAAVNTNKEKDIPV